MKKIIASICVVFCSCFCTGQTDSALYVKLRFHLIKNFEHSNDSISRKLASEIYFISLYENDNMLDSFTIWQSSNNVNYGKLENCMIKTMKELKGINFEKSIIVPVIIYNIDTRSWKDKKSRELKEYLKNGDLKEALTLNESLTIFKNIIITQMATPDNKKVY